MVWRMVDQVSVCEVVNLDLPKNVQNTITNEMMISTNFELSSAFQNEKMEKNYNKILCSAKISKKFEI